MKYRNRKTGQTGEFEICSVAVRLDNDWQGDAAEFLAEWEPFAEWKPPEPSPRPTVRVRICIGIDPDGDWIANGYACDKTDAERFGNIPSHWESHCFIEADVPLPRPETIQGVVQEGKSQ